MSTTSNGDNMEVVVDAYNIKYPKNESENYRISGLFVTDPVHELPALVKKHCDEQQLNNETPSQQEQNQQQQQVLTKISTGIGFLDHMIDQFNSHAQIGVAIQVERKQNKNKDDQTTQQENEMTHNIDHTTSIDYVNRYAYPPSYSPSDQQVGTINCCDILNKNQSELLSLVGNALGHEFKKLLMEKNTRNPYKRRKVTDIKLNTNNNTVQEPSTSSRFACPLDEALTLCCIETFDNVDDEKSDANSDTVPPPRELLSYTLGSPSYGKYHRQYIGHLRTIAIEHFWLSFVTALQSEEGRILVQFDKIRGKNAHHIVESSFKAFSRAFRNLLDDITTDQTNVILRVPITPPTTTATKTNLEMKLKESSKLYVTMLESQLTAIEQDPNNEPFVALYGRKSKNTLDSIQLNRSSTISRSTNETSITIKLTLDGGNGKGICINTGVHFVDLFYTQLAVAANISLSIICNHGDLFIDEHHTVEDIAIAFGQCFNQALSSKAGLNRMWTSTCTIIEHKTEEEEKCIKNNTMVEVTMDLSNRPELHHNLQLCYEYPTIIQRNENEKDSTTMVVEKVHDLSLEMFEHLLESFVVNARMTVHIVDHNVVVKEQSLGGNGSHKPSTITTDNIETATDALQNTILATAVAFGQCLKYCIICDQRRLGTTASSKGTLSV